MKQAENQRYSPMPAAFLFSVKAAIKAAPTPLPSSACRKI